MATKKAAAKVATPAKTAQPVAVARVNVKVNEAARVKGGKYADLAGIVQEISEDGTRAKLLIQGVKAGDSVDALEWFGAEEVEANK